MKSIALAVAFGGLVLTGTGGLSMRADAAEIRVLGSPAIKEAYLELAPKFEKETGHKVVTEWAGTVDIKKRLAAGEAPDLVLMVSDGLDEQIKLGIIAEGTRADLVRSKIGAAVRAGAPKPDLSTEESFKATLLAAKSIGISTGPSGVYLRGLFRKLGVDGQIKDKLRLVKPGESVGVVVASGEAEIAFQQISEVINVKGVDYVGPIPDAVQNVSTFSIGQHAKAKEIEAGKAWVQFLKSPAAAPAIKHAGLDPA